MDMKRANYDLYILTQEYGPQNRHQDWRRGVSITWEKMARGMMIKMENFRLPKNCDRIRTKLWILMPPNLYDPAGNDSFHFYQDQWMDGPINIIDPKNGGWGPLPRLWTRSDGLGWYYCLHGQPVGAAINILHHIRAIELEIMKSDPSVW